jgi:rRNA maturation RNase YbeY
VIEVCYNNVEEVPDLDSELLVLWLLAAVKEEGFVCENLSVVFCSDAFLIEMNRSYLNHDFYTDIITFDYSDWPTLSGELYISLDRVQENSIELKQEFLTELRRVCVHGILHLCGYKDKLLEEEMQMREMENYYLKKYVSRET